MKSLFYVLLLSLLGVSLAGCTTVVLSDTQLPMSSSNRCAGPAGVSVRYHTLTIAIGERPHTGYGIEMVGQQQQNGDYQLMFRETLPQPGMNYAQMLVFRCLQVVLPQHWRSVQVTIKDSGQQWQLTPADGSGLSQPLRQPNNKRRP